MRAVPVRRGGRGDPDPDAGLRRRRVARLRAGGRAGQAYGYRAAGPYDPARGVRCNPAKLLLDPYARAVSGTVTFGPEVLGYAAGDPDAPSAADSARSVPRSLVVADEPFGWQDGDRPWHRYADTIIYEMHVKGFTMRHPEIPPELRGTYAGPGPRGGHRPPARPRRDRGRTAAGARERPRGVPGRSGGLTNYWGYNTIGYFAPHQGYSAAVRAGRPGGQVDEFKAMVDALHAAGIEVILDVVFNHTAESRPDGPTLCFRGLDNPAYYRLEPGDPGAVHRHDRLRQLAERRRPGDPAADHGLAAVLDDRDARRRLPVRPGPHPGPPGGRVRRPCRPSSTWSRRIRWCPGPS